MRLQGFITTLMLCLSAMGCRTQLLWQPFSIAMPDFGIISHETGDYVSTMGTIVGRCYADGGTVTLSGDLSGGPFPIVCDVNGDLSLAVTFLPTDGSKTITLTQTDVVGASHTQSIVVTLDSVPPAYTVTAPSGGTNFSGSITVTGACEIGTPITATGAGLSITPASFACTTGTYSRALTITGTDGAITLMLEQKDLASNSWTIPVSLVLDTTDPFMAITSPGTNQHIPAVGSTLGVDCDDGLSYMVSGTDLVGGGPATCSSGSITLPFSFTGADGSKTITVVATDLAGNTTTDSIVLISDRTSPALVPYEPVDTEVVKGTYTLSGECEVGGTVNLSGTIMPSPASFTCPGGGIYGQLVNFGAAEGARTFTIAQSDTAGNSTSQTVNLILDTTAPVVNFSSPAANSYHQATFNVSGTCETGRDVHLDGAITTGMSTSCVSGAFSFVGVEFTAGDGSKTLSIEQSDSAGNSTTNFRSFYRDTTGPLITPSGMMAYYYGNAVSAERPSIGGTMSDPGVGVQTSVLEYSNDGGGTYNSLTSGSTLISYLWSTPPENTTNGFLRITSTDLLGNTSVFTHPMQIMTVVPRIPSAQNWNDYYMRSNLTACAAGTPLSSDPCIHGAEQKRVLAAGYTSCTNLTAQDSLGAFNWTCLVASGHAFFQGQLKETKGLRDLVNATSWKNNSVEISFSGTPMRQTLSKAWWTNVVQAQASNTGSVAVLSSASTIYTFTGAINGIGINLNANKIALVSLPGGSYNTLSATIGYNQSETTGETGSDIQTLIGAGANHFLWIEVESSSQNMASNIHNGVYLVGSKFSRIHRSTFGRYGSIGINFLNGGGNRVTQTRISDAFQGLGMTGSTLNRVSDFYANNIWNYGVSLTGSSKNSFSGLLLTNLGYAAYPYDGLGIILVSSTLADNYFSRVTVTNAKDAAFVMQSGVTGALHNGLFANNGVGSGMATLLLNDSITEDAQNTFSQLAMSETYIGIDAEAPAASNKFTGNMLVSGSYRNCRGANPDFGIYGSAGTCLNGSGGTFSDAIFNSFLTLSASFFGALTATSGGDVSNSTDNAVGTASYSGTLDLFRFDNTYRTWGRGGGFPGSPSSNSCYAGATCQVYDWSLLASTSEVVNNSDNAFAQNDPFIAGSICPNAVDGNNILTTALGAAYLKTAVEILNDDLGNDNGLCESNESCLYTPHYGYYQGQGALSECTFSSGTISGVKIYGYTVMGSLDQDGS